ncbi:hypothetical protein GDO86_002119 [Hymenochirus boettgeri]|uniref:Synergin gamma C-terminal domain-containing protein n=1 Tax=Hymenochirus boettgeri TaxID=247094 RepID=A0A8T2KI67_9PIPI|nr:hypothetical protein GDO86_002119 [Hymenochirus boettgeri]
MESYISHLMKCLENIHRVIKKANDILSDISHPSVCSEILLSSRGTDYISGLLEVYRVSKKMESGMVIHNICHESIWFMFREIELSWNNLQAFLSVCPCILHKLPSPSTLNWSTNACHSDSAHCLRKCCSVCLVECLDVDLNGREAGDCLQVHEGQLYHASCANFWLHCVDFRLPVLSCNNYCTFCTILKDNKM